MCYELLSASIQGWYGFYDALRDTLKSIAKNSAHASWESSRFLGVCCKLNKQEGTYLAN